MSGVQIEKPSITRIAALDYGLARIGIAVSDETKTIALPFMTLSCEKKTSDTAKKLVLLLEEHQKANHYTLLELVIGLPLLMNGTRGYLADETQYFISLLKNLLSIPVVSWDERLTSVQAERTMKEGKLNRKKRAKSVDNVAAIIILQNYLDHLKLRHGGTYDF
ncbi:Holliday junction resolvase RuvX [Neochlamydia sp. AcF84]|uniref:Holliday junction resolvase RuvX n=1 Tax=Neochlamydia sp. AcF84 TaxID=2315858 RepID=UPI00140CDFE4|nr:Holliday junction resolvase RuvX [Neochlamydia sp. AcF84]